MFQQKIQPFGRFTAYEVTDEENRCGMVVSPDGCACLLGLTLGGQQVLDAYDVPESLSSNAWFKNVPLFPFPNRLRDGAYEWEGETHHFSINDGANGAALHGLSREFSAAIARSDHHGEEATIGCRYQSSGDQRGYPFLYTFEITYHLQAPNRFESVISFSNNDNKNIPCGLGWHPYFRLTERINDLQLQLPPCEMIGIDHRMLPTGKRYTYEEFSSLHSVGSTVLDNCFALQPTGDRAEAILAGEKGRLRIWMETGPGGFNFLQVFTHPDRVSLAVEPMTCNIDAFNNGEGLITLEPGQTIAARFGVIWEENN